MALRGIGPSDNNKYSGHEVYIRLHYPIELQGVNRGRLEALLTRIQKCKNSQIAQYACTLGATITPDGTGTKAESPASSDSSNVEYYFCKQAPPNVDGGKAVPTILVEIHFSVQDYRENAADEVATAITQQVWNVLVKENTDCGGEDFKIRYLKYTEARTAQCSCVRQCPTQSLSMRPRRETDV